LALSIPHRFKVTKLEVREEHQGMDALTKLTRVEGFFIAKHNFLKIYFISLNEIIHVR
jgi:hypothetical protein